MLNNLPLITIITPTYNRRELLEKAILSVINQKQDIPFERELIIVDDGSIDGTGDYINKYLEQYPENIKYYYQANSGVGKARNVGIDNINKNSDYLIFLDSDDELKLDCIGFFLNKFIESKNKGTYENTLGYYFLCEDENGNIIGNKSILNGAKEVYFYYNSFLKGDINVEMGLITKSYIFLEGLKLRFEEDIITEGVMWAKMWKYMSKVGLKIGLFDYVGRLYNINHNGEIKITKTISEDRFRKNALGNERILYIIGNDLISYGNIDNYAELLFRTGINWILFGDKNKGLFYLKQAIKYKKTLRNLLLYVLSFFNKNIILQIYKFYVR